MKNLKVNKKMFAILLGGTMLMGTMVGCGQATINEKEVVTERETKVFEPGEHIVTVFYPMTKRLEHKEGYEIVAASQSINKYIDIIYQNTVPVECIEDIEKNDYTEFGTPTELEKIPANNQDEITEGQTKIFNVGEHIITDSYLWSIDGQRLECHEGYEIVASMQGDSKQINVIYRNTIPVECVAVTYYEYYTDTVGPNEKCDYVEFGTPIELEKTYTMK